MVEDNQVNQMVAVGLLESAGYVADVAEDGLEAVAAMAGDHGYAAVLMDCRMPRMDGFTATRAIRAQERPGVPGADHRHDSVRAPGRAGALPRGGDGRLPDQARRRSRLQRVMQQWTTDDDVEPVIATAAETAVDGSLRP